jgi:signal transduction histidine kinase
LVACNRIHLFQILDNLISNALKFAAPDRPPHLEVGVTGEPGYPSFFVKDNGIGIARTDHERIFAPFERLGTHDAPGTGIGLAIVKKIIELYQGKVWVDSDTVQGSIFYFTLPLYGQLAAVPVARREAQ